ncbi:MAG: heme o synthase [Dehalococcoidia bacterium]
MVVASSVFRDYVTLTKPRVMALLLLTTVTGMVLAARGFPAGDVFIAVLAGGACASGGAGALNHWLERDLDRRMRRTSARPVASGRIPARRALVFGLALNVGSFALLYVWANLLAAALALAGTLIYVFIYTLWLKRSTIQNIVIGGAAGAIPPLVGWAAVTGGLNLSAWYLFTIIFFWTPPHFWALALMIRDDYRAAGIPMLPAVAGRTMTHWSILLYTVLLLALTALFTVATDQLGMIYLSAALVLGVLFVGFAARLFWDSSRPAVLGLYKYSLLYLALLFLFVMLDGSIA